MCKFAESGSKACFYHNVIMSHYYNVIDYYVTEIKTYGSTGISLLTKEKQVYNIKTRVFQKKWPWAV